jgi:alpha-tubulin suppressor-like RCC1 family protein
LRLWANGLTAHGVWGNGLWGNGLLGNGLWGNGLWGNGLWGNGLWGNGLWGNGLWGNGLSTTGGPPLEGSPAALLQSSKYLRQLLQYVYGCAMPGALDPITNTPNQTSYNTALDPWGGKLTCTPPSVAGNDDPGCPDSTYTCTEQGTCVIPLKGAIGLAINADGSGWWGEAADGSFPDYTQSAVGGLAGTCDESCQRWVSACVLARTNAYGVHVEISMRAPANAPPAIQRALATTGSVNGNPPEATLFPNREGAYYGNIFETTPVPSTPPSPSYSGPATGSIIETPIYTACAGPESNVPEITKRFESSQGDQVVISVPGLCLAKGTEPGVCAGVDTNPSSPTYGSIQHCYTSTSLTSTNACATIPGPRPNVPEPADPTCYDQVITVFLADPIAVCGNGVCEPPAETPACCPTDCHPATWAKDFSPLLQTGSAYQVPACTAASVAGGNCPAAPLVEFAPNAMSALAADGSVAIAGNASVDICPDPTQCPLALGTAELPATDGTAVLVKYNADGSAAWPAGGVRFGNTPPVSSVNPLQSVSGIIVGTNPSSAPTSPDHTGNITVAGVTTQVGTSNQQLWISSFQPDGTPLGTWIPQLVGNPTLSPFGGTLAFDSQSNLVLAVNTASPTTSFVANVASIALDKTTFVYGSACMLIAGGTVACWGNNSDGQLGNGTTNLSTFPAPVPDLSGVTAVALGDAFACALMSDGSVQCWGAAPADTTTTPVTVSGLAGATAISAGGGSACAITSGGAVNCWGDSSSGKLGNGGGETSSDPVAVVGLTGATAISVGVSSSCAIVSGGAVKCWGDNFFGQLGNGTDGSENGSAVPVAVVGLTNATSVSVGDTHACALLAGGAVECWGANFRGELGIDPSAGPETCDSSPCSTTPIAVAGLAGPATAIAVQSSHASCALLTNGTVECWGSNEEGQLGIGTAGAGPQTCLAPTGPAIPYACSPSPVPVTSLTGRATAISGGGLGACAVLSNRTVECWGSSDYLYVANTNAVGFSPFGVPGPPIQPSVLVMKTSLPPEVPQAPVLWASPIVDQTISPSTVPMVNFPQSLVIDPGDNVVVVASDTTLGVGGGTLHKICSDGTVTSQSVCPDGSQAWGGNMFNSPYFSAAAVDPNGNIYAGGISYSASNASVGTPFVRKFDPNGNALWPAPSSSAALCPALGSSLADGCMSHPPVQAVSMGFDGGGNIVLASFGNPAIGGGINFGPVGEFPTFPTYGSPNIFLSAYDPSTGDVEWAKQIQTILSGSLHGMALGNQGQIVVAGNYSGSMQVDSQLLITASPESPSVTDSFLASFAEPVPAQPTIGQGSTCSGLSFTTVPSDIFVPATSAAGACVFYMPPTSTWATTVTCSPPPNTTFPIGSTPVRCTAFDAYGNTPSTLPPPFHVTVFDPPPPVLASVPAAISRMVAGPTAITYTAPVVIDPLDNPASCSSCAGPLTPSGLPGPPSVCTPPPVYATCTPGSGSTFPMGTTTVSCTTTDSAGRTASASFTVTLIPEVTTSCVGAPGSPAIVPVAPDTCRVAVSNASAVAGTCGGPGLQLCTFDGHVSETLGPGNYSIAVVGTAVDLSTTASCISYVRVVDTTAPVITVPAAVATQYVVGNCSGGMVGPPVLPTASDACQGSVPVTCTTAPGTHYGPNTVTCTAQDASGNTSHATLTLIVLEPLAVRIQPPLAGDNGTVANVVKDGSTVPNKVLLLNCGGVDVTRTASVVAKLGVTYVPNGGAVVADPVTSFNGAGDANGVMVFDGTYYHYNLSTKGYALTAGVPGFYRENITVAYQSAPSVVVGSDSIEIDTK